MNAMASGNTLLRFGIATVDQAREQGFTCLNPTERQFGIDFVVCGGSLLEIAKHMNIAIREAKAMFNDPIVRGFIADLQAEVLQHRLVNEQWVEGQILEHWPKLTGEEPVPLIDKNGDAYLARKYHSTEIVSILKHFGGNKDQKAAGGVSVQINFGSLGIGPQAPPAIDVTFTDVTDAE